MPAETHLAGFRVQADIAQQRQECYRLFMIHRVERPALQEAGALGFACLRRAGYRGRKRPVRAVICSPVNGSLPSGFGSSEAAVSPLASPPSWRVYLHSG